MDRPRARAASAWRRTLLRTARGVDELCEAGLGRRDERLVQDGLALRRVARRHVDDERVQL
jgi:hypothetical protein